MITSCDSFVIDRHACLTQFQKGKFSKLISFIGYKESLLALVLYDLNKFPAFRIGNHYAWESDSDICDDPWNLNIENDISLGILYRKLICFFQHCSFWQTERKDKYKIMSVGYYFIVECISKAYLGIIIWVLKNVELVKLCTIIVVNVVKM